MSGPEHQSSGSCQSFFIAIFTQLDGRSIARGELAHFLGEF
jgi:hypothetical protein